MVCVLGLLAGLEHQCNQTTFSSGCLKRTPAASSFLVLRWKFPACTMTQVDRFAECLRSHMYNNDSVVPYRDEFSWAGKVCVYKEWALTMHRPRTLLHTGTALCGRHTQCINALAQSVRGPFRGRRSRKGTVRFYCNSRLMGEAFQLGWSF